MKNKMRMICLFFCVYMTTFSLAMSNESQSPITMLQNVANSMLGALKNNKISLKQNPGTVYGLTRKIIVPHADLNEMSKRVLPPYIWNAATSAQRTAFQREFTTTLIRTYASALASYSDQTVSFFPIRGEYHNQSMVNVNSQINRPDGPPISVTYSLVKRNDHWKLYDMTVEGVSMLNSFRSQFADQLNRGDMANLIRVLQQHNANNDVKA